MSKHKYIEDLPEIIDHYCSNDIALPNSMDLEVTSRCNLRCSMCPKKEGLEPNPTNSDMSMETFENAKKTFPALDRMNLNGFGESFLHPDFIDMIREVKKYSILTNITTNGILISKKNARELILTGLDHLSFSLDSLDPESYKAIRGVDKLDRVLENLKLILKIKEDLGVTKPYVGISFTAMSRNIDNLPEIMEFARKNYLSSLSICPFDDYNNRFGFSMTNCLDKAREAFIKARNLAIQHKMQVNFNFETEFIAALRKRNPKDEFFKLFHRFIPTYKGVYETGDCRSMEVYRKYCDFPFFNTVISSEGDVLPCCKSTPKYKMGNINEKSFTEIWQGAKMRQFRRKLLSNNPPEICINCTTADWKPRKLISKLTDHFDSSYHDDTQMGLGFYHPDYDYSKKYWWTKQKATVFLHYNKQNYLEINAGTLMGKEIGNLRKVEVSLNDKFTGSFPLKYRFRNYILPIKGCEKDIAKITFKVDRIVCPDIDGSCDDKRKLGMALSRVEFVDGGFRTLFFTSDADTSHMIEGWAGPEIWGTWTIKKTARIKLDIEPGRSYQMIFYVCPFFFAGHQQKLKVFFEDDLLGEILFDKNEKDWQAYNILLPEKLIKTTSHFMSFESDYMVSPYEVTEGEVVDHRKLGVGFKLIKFRM